MDNAEAGKELGDSLREEVAGLKEDMVLFGSSWAEVGRAGVGTGLEDTKAGCHYSSLVVVVVVEEEPGAEDTGFQAVAAHMKNETAGNYAG